MIVSLLRIDCLIRFLNNTGHLVFFGHGYLLYCHDGELIQGQIHFTPILKPQQNLLITRYPLYYTSQILNQSPRKYFRYLLLQLTYLGIDNHTHQYLVPPPPSPATPLCVEGVLRRSGKNIGVHYELNVSSLGGLLELINRIVPFF